MQAETGTNYSLIGHKRRKLATSSAAPPMQEMKRASSAPTEPKGSWIGLKISIQKSSLKINKNNENLRGEKIFATIHDYDNNTNESQIWINIDNNDNKIYIDFINLTEKDLWFETVGDIKENKRLSIPTHSQWIPMTLKIGSNVIIYNKLKGIIDSFDSMSRRHHISYFHQQNENNLKMSEWIWCNNENTKLFDNNNTNNHRITKQIKPPPFDYIIYGLNDTFIKYSGHKRNYLSINDGNHESSEIKVKKRKFDANYNIISNESPLMSRIPKMKENNKNNDDNNDTLMVDNRDIISISSTSASPPKQTKFSRNRPIINVKYLFIYILAHNRPHNRDMIVI